MASQQVKVAIVGTGAVARAHVKGYRQSAPQAAVVAACDPDEGKVHPFAAAQEIPRAYTDTATMLKSERPEVVSICTPPSVHAELSIRCMEAGAWVLCEKPLCASLEELDRIGAVEEATGCYTESVFQWRYGSAAQHLKLLFDQGVLGRPFVAACNTTWYRTQRYYDVPWRGTWKSELGGVTMGLGIHLIDLLLWLLGPWREVQATAGTLARDMETEDVSAAVVRFENGAIGTVLSSVLSPRQESYLRLDFEKATVEVTGLYTVSNRHWRLSRGCLAGATGDATQQSIPPGSSSEGSADSEEDELLSHWGALERDVPGDQAAQIGQFLQDRYRNRRPGASGHGIRGTLEFVAALYKSAFTTEGVGAGTIGPGDPFYHRMCAKPCRVSDLAKGAL